MADSTDTARAAQLKEEGNKLYIAKDYAAAYFKYSEAIEADNKNAVLYANRGACSFAMDKFLDAAADCDKATELDPLYSKAWARLGAARKNAGQFPLSEAAYLRALSSLPVENLSQADKNIKQQCETDLRAVRAKMVAKSEVIVKPAYVVEEMPWKRALKMEKELTDRGPAGYKSSGWVMLKAYREFKSGIDMIKQVRKVKVPGMDGYQIVGQYNGLTQLSNALLVDGRVFHLDDRKFLDQYNLQVELEATRDKALDFLSGGAQYITQEALNVKAKGGWDAVRSAITTTVRIWIVRAFVLDGANGNSAEALQYYDQVIEVLEWGRQVWRHEPKDNRGAVFEATFLRGVKALRMDCYMKANTKDRTRFPLEALFQDAKDMVHELQNAPKLELTDPGFISAFCVYPFAQSYAMMGLYFRDLARTTALQKDADQSEVENYYHQAGGFYIQAGLMYPQDDENHIYYLCCGLDMLLVCGTPAGDLLASIDAIHAAEPEMKKIWEFSTLSPARDAEIARAYKVEAHLREAMAKGEMDMETKIWPRMLPEL